ncbi:hypothetical protein [Undibacterium sp. Ji49W]|uniref:hypothetical protein n=1 Tax=Undibacterium sp. Ji49W TaxID=3413040 RepID=UPI003BF366FE
MGILQTGANMNSGAEDVANCFNIGEQDRGRVKRLLFKMYQANGASASGTRVAKTSGTLTVTTIVGYTVGFAVYDTNVTGAVKIALVDVVVCCWASRCNETFG